MSLPCFYVETIHIADRLIVLDEDTSRHCVQVLRMKAGEQLHLTDGRGTLHTTQIINDHKKSTQVQILSTHNTQPPKRKISIGISLVKNTSRFEWFVEKATEIGVSQIIPLICERTEKQYFRSGRMKSILISAMLQSRQVWLPDLKEPLNFTECLAQFNEQQNFIAHCQEDEKSSLRNAVERKTSALIVIGPEGDFTGKEIEMALDNNFIPVTLGETRLRTETAGVVAVTLLNMLYEQKF